MFFYKERLLTNTQLKRLGDHKYSCTSVSLLDALLQPWWTWLVSLVPLWLAPNLITIVGLIVNIVTTLILVWYSPDAKSDAPRWTYFLCGLGLFIYQSLDAIDGKQARRTGTSSPLGELFDHGCDSISTVFVALSACAAVRLGQYPTWMFLQCFCAITLFYCAHWQTYVSGTLKFGKVDVTEAQYTIIGIHMVSAIFGSEIWLMQISQYAELRYLLGVMTFVCSTYALYNTFSVILGGGAGRNGSTVAIPATPLCWANTLCLVFFLGYIQVFLVFIQSFHQGGVGRNGSTVAIPIINIQVYIIPFYISVFVSIYLGVTYGVVIFTGGVGKNGSSVAGTSVLSPVIPFSMVIIPAFIIYQKSESHVYENHPCLYIIAFGMVAAKVTNRLVVSHMTKSAMEYFDWSLLGPAMLFMNQYFNNPIPEYYVLWMCLVWVLGNLTAYCCEICIEICDYLNIRLFHIPYPPSNLKNNTSQTIVSSASVEKNAKKFESDPSDVEDMVPLIHSP